MPKQTQPTDDQKRQIIADFFRWLYEEHNKGNGNDLVSLVRWTGSPASARPQVADEMIAMHLPVVN